MHMCTVYTNKCMVLANPALDVMREYVPNNTHFLIVHYVVVMTVLFAHLLSVLVHPDKVADREAREKKVSLTVPKVAVLTLFAQVFSVLVHPDKVAGKEAREKKVSLTVSEGGCVDTVCAGVFSAGAPRQGCRQRGTISVERSQFDCT